VKIEIHHLSKTYPGGVNALVDLDLEVQSGIIGLLGANGAGKTTLMRILAGVIRPTGGTVHLGGHDIATHAGQIAVKRTLGYLPQELGLYPELNGREFLDYIAVLKGMNDRSRRRARVDELLEIVGLTDASARKLKTLSGGMRQRIGIAQALLNDPRLLIVDEPTAGLDPEERIRFRTLLTQLAAKRTVILSTHIVDDIAQTSHQVAVLTNGRLIFHGTTEELSEAAHARVWALTTDGPAPQGALTIVSAIPTAGGAVNYRIVADETPTPEATELEPTLEDGYVALMRSQRPTLTTPAITG